jgi:crotonobetainyl-CoA:carnitine CoA-transferase CaiB-like acyl-CoA transferase
MDLGERDPTLADDLSEVMATRTLDDWMEALLAADVPASPVLQPEDLIDNPHVQHRRIIVDSTDERYPDIRYLRIPIEIPGTEFSVALPPPVLGEHTTEILGGLGYDETAQRRLSDVGAIAAWSR